MPPRTILGIIDGNRGVRNELTPNQRGKIQGARQAGATFKVASEIGECTPSTAKTTIRRAPERHNGISKPRSGRPKEWDVRFERRVIRTVRMHPKTTYAQLRDQLHTYLSHDTLARILKDYHISAWLSKQRPFLSPAVVKRRLDWALRHADWTWKDWVPIIWSDECSVERGAGARRSWVFRTPGQKWDKDMVDTYTTKDIRVMVWGAIWVGGRSDLFRITP
jgi:hypothetical protein